MSRSVQIPKDLSEVKEKVFMGLTARQLICFGSGLAIGIPVYIMSGKHLEHTIAMIMMIAVMMPFFLCAMYRKNGEPFEKVVLHYVTYLFIRPKIRAYKTENLYKTLTVQDVQASTSQRSTKGGNRFARNK